MELTREAEDALFALFAVKMDFVSEAVVEKAIARRDRDGVEGAERPTLSRCLIESGALSVEQARAVRAAVDPAVIAGYTIEGEAGRGGMGVVYRARQLSMDRVVAVKVLSRRLSNDETFVAKFLSEARSAAKLNHENIVAAINAGESAGLHYFVMEFVDGESVADQLSADGALDWRRAFNIAEQMARALGHAHQAGLVHRDVKPENIMLGAEGLAKLCDLGLAKPAQEAGTGEKSAMTEGTPYYCSPEQALGRTDIDARSDVYSLGTTLYHMLSGEPPFDGETARSIMVKQVREPFPDLTKKLPEVPAPLRDLLAAMVVKDRESRLGGMREFKERLLDGRRQASRSARTPITSLTGGGLDGGNLPVLLAVLAVFLVFAAIGIGVAVAVMGDDPEISVTPPPRDPVNTGGTDTGGTDTGGTDTGGTDTGGTDTGGTSTGGTSTGGTDTGGTSTGGTSTGGTSTGGTSTGGAEDDPELREARRLFREAQAYGAEHADDPWGATSRFAKVAELYPTSPIAREAERQIEGLEAQVRLAGGRALEELALEILGLLEEQRFRSADETVSAFEVTWTPRKLPKLKTRLARLRRSINQQAKAALNEAVANLQVSTDLAKAQTKLQQLAAELPKALAEVASARLRALESRAAQVQLVKVVSEARAAVAAGEAERARRILREAKGDPRLAVVKGQLQRALEDIEGMQRAQQALAGGCSALSEKGRLSLALACGGTFEGRVTNFDLEAWTATFQAVERPPRQLPLSDVAPRELIALALPAAEGRHNALMFLSHDAVVAAEQAFAAYVSAGGADDPGLRLEIKRRAAVVLEKRAADLITRLANPELDPDEAVLEICRIPARLRATPAYRTRFGLLKLAYERARTAQLSDGEANLFRGAVKLDRKGKLTLTYDFSDPEQARDFLLDTKVDRKSQRAVKADEGLVVRGKVQHIARWAGGELKVELRVLPKSLGNPNLNVILSSQRGWRGQLCGAGFKYGPLKQIKIDSSAKSKGGYLIDLPASVLIVLQGKKPRRRMPQVLAAEEKPLLKQKLQRIVVTRNRKGKIKLKVGTRTVYQVSNVKGSDEEGAVALAPFSSEFVVRELTIIGRLAEGWAAEFVANQAKAEADALPPPG